MSRIESLDPQSESGGLHDPAPRVSRLDRTLTGLDLSFALSALTERQGEGVIDKERQRRVIEMRYGLLDGQPMTRRAIAKEFDRSEQTIRNLEFGALFILREVRDEHRPERVFPRKRIFGLDNDYLHTPHDLKRIAERHRKAGINIKPQYEYPE